MRIHGRGGQGAVVASIILARAYYIEGFYVQSFPEFGVERRGSPVQAYLRADKNPIYERTKIYRPNQLIVLDQSLIKFMDITKDIAPESLILINSARQPSEFEFSEKFRVATVDAATIAVKYNIGTSTNPIVNTTTLGAYSKFSGLIKLEALKEAIAQSFSGSKVRDNIAAIEEAYEKVILPPVRSWGI
ncbi:MAG: 2-oxoacid:acceptor oxidoreductase family protein [Planctomycetota bacterium]